MEKLIELLSEYTNKHPLHIRMSEPYKGVYLQYDENFTVDIISKKFGFIKRLVDNDKINEYMITEIMINSQRRYTGKDKTTAQRVDENYTDVLLMLLAISDNPIEDLISYLK